MMWNFLSQQPLSGHMCAEINWEEVGHGVMAYPSPRHAGVGVHYREEARGLDRLELFLLGQVQS